MENFYQPRLVIWSRSPERKKKKKKLLISRTDVFLHSRTHPTGHARVNSRTLAAASRCIWRVHGLVALVRPTRHILLRLLSGDNTRHFCVATAGYRMPALRLHHLLFLLLSRRIFFFFFFFASKARNSLDRRLLLWKFYPCVLLTDVVLGNWRYSLQVIMKILLGLSNCESNCYILCS